MGHFHQSLITIPNRFAFLEKISEAVRQDAKLSLFLIDVVRFSDVSSSFGYQAGDAILVNIANRLRVLFGESAILGRVSGDIFGLVVFGTHRRAHLLALYNHLIEHFKSPVQFGEHAFIADFNVGVVHNNPDNHDINRLFAKAESALKQAKANKYENIYITGLSEKLDTGRSLALKADLNRAFEKQELEIYLQPKVDLNSLRIVGAECLLRWHHPLDGLVFPGALIEAAESYNMMNEVGYWTLEEAFKTAVLITCHGLNITLSVNISPTQLYDLNFIPTLKRLQREYGVDFNMFELELTEDIALSNSIMVKRQLDAARALGLSIAVDDFGKGYSNMAYMRDLRVDTVKVDKTFVMELGKNPVNKAIIQATQLISSAMDAKVVAEGIESIEHLHVLRELGIEVGQGFLFSRAIPMHDFIALAQSEITVGGSLCHLSRTA